MCFNDNLKQIPLLSMIRPREKTCSTSAYGENTQTSSKSGTKVGKFFVFSGAKQSISGDCWLFYGFSYKQRNFETFFQTFKNVTVVLSWKHWIRLMYDLMNKAKAKKVQEKEKNQCEVQIKEIVLAGTLSDLEVFWKEGKNSKQSCHEYLFWISDFYLQKNSKISMPRKSQTS